MSGKVWTFTFITIFSFFTIYVHHAQSICMNQDLQLHFYDHLLEEHLFEMKEFHDFHDQEQHKVLSVINTLCSTWIKNKNKDMKVIETFKFMLEHLFRNKTMDSNDILQECRKYNCSQGYNTKFSNIVVFGSTYLECCNKSLSGLKCPSITNWSTASSTRPTVSQLSTTSSTFSTLTDSPTSIASTSSPQKSLADMSSKVVLAASLLLNVLLPLVFLVMWYCRKKSNNQESQVNAGTGVRLLEIRDSNL